MIRKIDIINFFMILTKFSKKYITDFLFILGIFLVPIIAFTSVNAIKQSFPIKDSDLTYQNYPILSATDKYVDPNALNTCKSLAEYFGRVVSNEKPEYTQGNISFYYYRDSEIRVESNGDSYSIFNNESNVLLAKVNKDFSDCIN